MKLTLVASEPGLKFLGALGRGQKPIRRLARRIGEGGAYGVPTPEPIVGHRVPPSGASSMGTLFRTLPGRVAFAV